MDTLRPYTCKLYPFTIDENNYLYLSTTCPDFGKVIDRIMKKDPETIEWVRTNKIVAEKVPFELKKFWGNQIRTNRSVVVWINTEAT
jgi:Fe-S-cluster containining protein